MPIPADEGNPVQDSLDDLRFHKPRAPRRVMLRINQRLDRLLLAPMFINEPGRTIAAFLFALAVVITVAARTIRAADSIWFAILLVVVLAAVWEIHAWIIRPIAYGPLADRLVGKPLFGKLGWYRRVSYEAYALLSHEIDITFSKEDKAAVERFSQIEKRILKEELRQSYVKEVGGGPLKAAARKAGGRKARAEEILWKEIQDRYAGRSVTPDEFLSTYGSGVVPPTVERSGVIIGGVFDWVQMGLLVAIVLRLFGVIDTAWLLRGLVLGGLIAAAACALYLHAFEYEEITLSPLPRRAVPGLTDADRAVLGKVVRPTSVRRGGRFTGVFRGYLLRAGVLLRDGTNTLTVIWLATVCFAIGVLVAPGAASALLSWYGRLALYTVGGGVLLILSFVIMSVLIERKLALILFVALFALLPIFLRAIGLGSEGADTASAAAPIVIVLVAFATAISKVLEEAINDLRP